MLKNLCKICIIVIFTISCSSNSNLEPLESTDNYNEQSDFNYLSKTKIGKKQNLQDLLQTDSLNFIIDLQDLDNIVGTRALNCNMKRVTVWKLERFESKSGKKVGIWPGSYNTTTLTEYKSKFGFNRIRIHSQAEKNNANSSGFSDSEFMIQLPHSNGQYQQRVNDFINSNEFYLDEPLERKTYTIPQIIQVKDYIHSAKNGAEFTVGGWSRFFLYNNYHYRTYKWAYLQSRDFGVVFSSYSGDQRDDWNKMRSQYGSGNPFVWINAYKDNGDFYNLIEHANNKGHNYIWLYIGGDGGENNVEAFCTMAHNFGYLKRFMRKYIYEYKCDEPDPCANCDQNDPMDWYLDFIFETQIVEER